jgi:hypothetical protein
MPNRNNPLTHFVLNELEKKRRKSGFDHDYYIDLATGEVKKRLYVKETNTRKSRIKKENEKSNKR